MWDWGATLSGEEAGTGSQQAGLPVPKKPRRWDLQAAKGPLVRGTKSHAQAVAVEIARGDESSLRELDDGKFTPTSRRPKESRRTLVEDLIIRATGSLYPLTTFKIRCAAACLKRAGYRAAAGYLGEAKAGHIRAKAPWTDDLHQEMKDCTGHASEGLVSPPGPRRCASAWRPRRRSGATVA